MPATPCQFDGMVQVGFEEGTIGQLGEGVIVGQLQHLIFMGYLLGNIVDCAVNGVVRAIVQNKTGLVAQGGADAGVTFQAMMQCNLALVLAVGLLKMLDDLFSFLIIQAIEHIPNAGLVIFFKAQDSVEFF